MTSTRFEDVECWQLAHAWLLRVYRLTEAFPRTEQFGLTSQLRRAAISIPANFAEGKKRSIADKVRFYNIAQGSLEACRYYLIFAGDLGYGETNELRGELDRISRVLASYMRATVKKGAP